MKTHFSAFLVAVVVHWVSTLDSRGLSNGIQFSVPGSPCLVLSAQFSVLSSQFSVLSTQFSVLSTQYSVLSFQVSVLSANLRSYLGVTLADSTVSPGEIPPAHSTCGK